MHSVAVHASHISERHQHKLRKNPQEKKLELESHAKLRQEPHQGTITLITTARTPEPGPGDFRLLANVLHESPPQDMVLLPCRESCTKPGNSRHLTTQEIECNGTTNAFDSKCTMNVIKVDLSESKCMSNPSQAGGKTLGKVGGRIKGRNPNIFPHGVKRIGIQC